VTGAVVDAVTGHQDEADQDPLQAILRNIHV